jgi:hypothetical protein
VDFVDDHRPGAREHRPARFGAEKIGRSPLCTAP